MPAISKSNRSPAVEKAIRTAKWAVTMTKWAIGFETGGKKVQTGKKVERSRRWQLVTFLGPHGREGTGIVDLVAIRRDTRTPGDFFEIVLIQVKGGGAGRPTTHDLERLRLVSERYHAKAVVLAEWKKGSKPSFYRLRPQVEEPWELIHDIGDVFR